MASVSSLDKDMRNIRLSKYTPQAANEIRAWIEEMLGERLAAGDLLDALKDGSALCKLVNLAAPPGVRFKQSSMPFVQMENISHFLRACQQPPLNLQSHDIFQTVDLYESKDPAQVLQCISAFSRKANMVNPSRFPSIIGEKSKSGIVSPQSTGGFPAGNAKYSRPRGASNTSEASSTPSTSAHNAMGGRGSPSRFSDTSSTSSKPAHGNSTSGGMSSWSKKTDEGATMPAWNIAQYGYMGGASQGNQGISFGGRRQITTPAPTVPSLAVKERKRREQEAEAERLRIEAEEAEMRSKEERRVEEERARLAEEQRWEEETRRNREQERLRVEEEKRRWEEEERRWKREEEDRIREEKEAEARLQREKQQKPTGNDSRPKLQGQYLSQYKAEQAQIPMKSGGNSDGSQRQAETDRIRELERQLQEAKDREARYERERQERMQSTKPALDFNPPSPPKQAPLPTGQNRAPYDGSTEDPSGEDQRELLQKQWSSHNSDPEPPPPLQPPRPLPTFGDQAPPKPPRPSASIEPQAPPQPPRPLPSPQKSFSTVPPPITTQQPPSPTPSPPPISTIPPRPLPNPANFTTSKPTTPTHPPSPRKSPFARPSSPSPTTPAFKPPPSPATTKSAFNKPPSSLLSREMELDRLRQQEWEDAQKATKAAADAGIKDEGAGWDVNQYGYLGGDSQNKVGAGIGFGGRRQLVGPRERPK